MAERQVGFVGVGQMGSGMVRSLLRNRFPVVAYDAKTQLVEAVVKEGASAGTSAKDVATRSEVVLSSLPDPEAVETAALGADGIIEGIRPGQIYIDLSSIDPLTTKKVGAALAEKGARMLDVPVGKGPPAAEAGDLTLMVGGDPAAVEEAQDVLRALGSAQFYCGPLGSGVAAKLVNNLVSCSIVALNAEALVLAAKAGVDLDVMVDIMNSTAAGNWHLQNNVGPKALSGDFSPNFKMALAAKDVRLALRMGLDYGVPLAMGQASHLVHTLGLAHGWSEEDQRALLKVVEHAAGAEARRKR